MRQNIIVWILLFLMVAGVSYAADAEGYVNQSMLVWGHIRYYDQFYPASAANITIKNPDNLTFAVTNQQMTQFQTGQFYYNFTPQVLGDHIYWVTYYNSTNGAIGGASAVISATYSPEYMINQTAITTTEVLQVIFESFLAVAIGILFIIVAIYMKNPVFFIISGVWFAGVSANISFSILNNGLNTNNVSSFTFFAMIAILLIYQGIATLLANKKEKERRRIQGDLDD